MPPQRIDGSANLHSTPSTLSGTDDAQTAPCPSEWEAILESVCDLINAILQRDNWDPLTLFAERAQAHIPPKEVLQDDPVGFGRDLIVDIPVDTRGIVDVFIDDFIGLKVDLEDTDTGTHRSLTGSLSFRTTDMQQHGRPSQTQSRDKPNRN